MQPTTITWRDLTLATGWDADYRLTALEGWEGRPPSRYEKQNRSRAHGAHSSPVWADERIVTVEGRTWTETERDVLFAELDARFTFDGGEEPLTVSVAGRTLTAGAQLLRFDPAIVRGEWGIGRFGWVAQWRCPDPLRYTLPGTALATGLPTDGGGLSYPLGYGLDYGAAGDPGRIVITNPGTAPAPVMFQVTGPLDGGFELSTITGQRLTYPVPVPAGEVISIDTATGAVLAQGTADRRSNLTHADWIQVPAGSSTTVQFTSLGAYHADALLTVPEPRGAYW